MFILVKVFSNQRKADFLSHTRSFGVITSFCFCSFPSVYGTVNFPNIEGERVFVCYDLDLVYLQRMPPFKLQKMATV